MRDPKTAYPRAMLALVAATVLTYALPVLYGVALQPDLDAWGEGSFGDLAAAVAPWLGVAMALGGVASNFAAGLNSFAMYSRFLQATAAEGYVPVAALARDDTTRFGTPVNAIALLTVSTLALTNVDFDALLAELDAPPREMPFKADGGGNVSRGTCAQGIGTDVGGKLLRRDMGAEVRSHAFIDEPWRN